MHEASGAGESYTSDLGKQYVILLRHTALIIQFIQSQQAQCLGTRTVSVLPRRAFDSLDLADKRYRTFRLCGLTRHVTGWPICNGSVIFYHLVKYFYDSERAIIMDGVNACDLNRCLR